MNGLDAEETECRHLIKKSYRTDRPWHLPPCMMTETGMPSGHPVDAVCLWDVQLILWILFWTGLL